MLAKGVLGSHWLLLFCQLDTQEQTVVKFKSKYKTFIYENAI